MGKRREYKHAPVTGKLCVAFRCPACGEEEVFDLADFTPVSAESETVRAVAECSGCGADLDVLCNLKSL